MPPSRSTARTEGIWPLGIAPRIGNAGSVPRLAENAVTEVPVPTAKPGPARKDAAAITAFGAHSAPSDEERDAGHPATHHPGQLADLTGMGQQRAGDEQSTRSDVDA